MFDHFYLIQETLLWLIVGVFHLNHENHKLNSIVIRQVPNFLFCNSRKKLIYSNVVACVVKEHVLFVKILRRRLSIIVRPMVASLFTAKNAGMMSRYGNEIQTVQIKTKTTTTTTITTTTTTIITTTTTTITTTTTTTSYGLDCFILLGISLTFCGPLHWLFGCPIVLREYCYRCM